MITSKEGDTIALAGVKAASLSAKDFVFAPKANHASLLSLGSHVHQHDFAPAHDLRAHGGEIA